MSIFVGNTVVILVKLGGVVANSVVEVNTDDEIVGLEVTLPLGSISMHGVVGEVGTIVTDINSGQGVVEEIVKVVVILVEEVIVEDMDGEVLVVKGEEVGKAVTEEEPLFPVLKEGEDLGERLVVVMSTEFSLV